MQFAVWIYEHFFEKYIDMEKEIKEKRKLAVATNEHLYKQIKEEYIVLIQKLALCIMVLFVLIIAVILKSIMQEDGKIHLPRDGYDGETITYELKTDASVDASEVLVEVQPRQYTDEEKEELFQDGFLYVEKNLLGENQDYEHVCKPLNLISSIPDSPLRVELFWDNDELLDEEGNIIYEAFADTESMSVQVVLSYGEDCREQSIQLILCQPSYSKMELVLKNIQQQLQNMEQQSLQEEQVLIPKEMDGVMLSYEDNNSAAKGWLIFILAVPLLIYYQHKQKRKDALAAREEELLIMYPEIVNQLVLYLGAGMTIKGCFVQLVNDYQIRKEKQNKVEYFYEECSAMVQELRSGGSERNCYETLGKQLDLSVYRKLMTLLSQNLTKGSKGLLDLLQQEMEDALQYQKAYARKRGEEAGTKLLFPMLMLLVVVMVIIMIPGFMVF